MPLCQGVANASRCPEPIGGTEGRRTADLAAAQPRRAATRVRLCARRNSGTSPARSGGRGLPGSATRRAASLLGQERLECLRERVGLTGTKGACEQGECGSCSVLVDGALVCSCLVLAASAVGRRIVTIEGVAPSGAPDEVQQAFLEIASP